MKLNYLVAVSSLFTILIFVTGCQRKSSVETGSRNFGPLVMLPKHVSNAEVEPAAEKDSAVIVTIPLTEQFYVGGEQYPKEVVGEKVSRLLDREAEPNRIVYIRGGLSLDYGEVANVIYDLRKVGVAKLGFWVESPAGASGPSVLRVQIPPEPDVNEDLSNFKPDPRTLVVSIAKDLKLKLNQETMGAAEDPGKLTETLTGIFQKRKELRAYKRGLETRTDLPEDERVEKAVVVKAQRSTRYGDVVRLIGDIKGTGAGPIVLQIDDLSE